MHRLYRRFIKRQWNLKWLAYDGTHLVGHANDVLNEQLLVQLLTPTSRFSGVATYESWLHGGCMTHRQDGWAALMGCGVSQEDDESCVVGV